MQLAANITTFSLHIIIVISQFISNSDLIMLMNASDSVIQPSKANLKNSLTKILSYGRKFLMSINEFQLESIRSWLIIGIQQISTTEMIWLFLLSSLILNFFLISLMKLIKCIFLFMDLTLLS